MKLDIWAIVLIGLIGITPPLCSAETAPNKTSIKEVKQEAQGLLQRLSAYTADQKDEAVRKTKTAVDELGARADASWDKLDKDARKKARDSLEASRTQRNQAAEWYGRLKSGAENGWEHTKQGFANAYKTLKNALGKSGNNK